MRRLWETPRWRYAYPTYSALRFGSPDKAQRAASGKRPVVRHTSSPRALICYDRRSFFLMLPRYVE